jgi:hypothetical protein
LHNIATSLAEETFHLLPSDRTLNICGRQATKPVLGSVLTFFRSHSDRNWCVYWIDALWATLVLVLLPSFGGGRDFRNSPADRVIFHIRVTPLASELFFPLDAIGVLIWTEMIDTNLPTPGDCGVSETVPDLDQDLDGVRFGHSMVQMLTARLLKSAPKRGLPGSEDCPVQRLELVRVTGRNEPKPDSENCCCCSDSWSCSSGCSFKSFP